MPGHQKLANQPFPGDFLEQAAFQPLSASFYLAIGHALLEILVYYPAHMTQPILEKFRQVFHELQPVVAQFSAQASMEVVSSLVVSLGNPDNDLAARSKKLEDTLRENRREAATALQLFCRFCLATWLPQHARGILDSPPQQVELMLHTFCKKFRIACQFSRISGLTTAFGPAEAVPVFFLHEAGPEQYVLLYHRKMLDRHKGFSVDIDAFPFVAAGRNTGEAVEALAKYCLNQERENLSEALKQAIQTEAIVGLLQQLGGVPSINAPANSPQLPRANPLLIDRSSPLVAQQVHLPPNLAASAVPSANMSRGRPGIPSEAGPMARSQVFCFLCQQFKDSEYFELVKCSAHKICSICRIQHLSSSINCPACKREYSNNEVDMLEMLARDASSSSFH